MGWVTRVGDALLSSLDNRHMVDYNTHIIGNAETVSVMI
jgi:hypothetical protein